MKYERKLPVVIETERIREKYHFMTQEKNEESRTPSAGVPTATSNPKPPSAPSF